MTDKSISCGQLFQLSRQSLSVFVQMLSCSWGGWGCMDSSSGTWILPKCNQHGNLAKSPTDYCSGCQCLQCQTACFCLFCFFSFALGQVAIPNTLFLWTVNESIGSHRVDKLWQIGRHTHDMLGRMKSSLGNCWSPVLFLYLKNPSCVR